VLWAQQEAPPVFRAQVDAIQFDVSVTDARGNPVTDLTIADFEVLEDGKQQAVTAVSLVDIPVERVERPLFSPTVIEPDTQTNQRAEGRLYVFAFDEVCPAMALRTRHFMRRFIEDHFAANDVGAVVWVGRGRSFDTQDFTSNPRLLRDLLEFMAKLHGRRKTLMYVTEQIADVQTVLDFNGGVRSLAFEDLQQAMIAATRGNVSIYPIDPRGLQPEALGIEDIGALGIGECVRAPTIGEMADLRAMAEATGGFALVNSNSFDQTFERIVRENSSYYILGFTSSNERRDGRYRRVQVRVRRPGLQVRTRDGYVAPTSRTPRPTATRTLASAVGESLGLPIANPAVPMTVFAAPYRRTGRETTVAIALEMDISRLDLTASRDLLSGEIEMATTAINAAGKVFKGEQHRLRLALKPDTYTRAQANGLRLLSEMALPAGRYQLRVAAGNTGSNRAGSVMYDLDVPDFTKAPLVMSGVSLTSAAAARSLTLTPKTPLRDVFTTPLTASREFTAGDTLTTYVEVYENLRKPAAHTVDLAVTLRSDEGRVVRTITDERSLTASAGQSGGEGFLAQVPLDVDPGIYVIHVEARSTAGERPTVSRDIQIRVH
jgi:hypothetical protein